MINALPQSMKSYSMKSSLVLSALVVTLSTAAHGQQYPILELRAQGSKMFSSDDVIRASRLSVDAKKEVLLTQVSQAAERLVGSGVFSEVNYLHTELRNGMKVEFTVKDKEPDQFVPAKFENFVWWPDGKLVSELHTRVPLFAGQVPLGGGLGEELATELESMIKARGVKGHVTNLIHNAATGVPESVDFEVEDWPVRVSTMTTPGASADFAQELQKAGRRLVGLNYHRSTLNHFAENNLRDIYLKKGYLKAHFAAPEAQVVDDIGDKETETRVAVSIPVQEGAEYKLGSLGWSGNQQVPTKDLLRHIDAQAGETLDGVTFTHNITRLREDYAMRGYLHMAAEVTPRYDDAAQTVSYDIAIQEGDLFSMGKLSVDGLTQASAEKVHQAWKLREGDPFNRAYLKEFLGSFRMPNEAAYVIEQSEGEAPNSIDVTVIFCHPQTPCRPSGPNTLYSPTAAAAAKAGAATAPGSNVNATPALSGTAQTAAPTPK